MQRDMDLIRRITLAVAALPYDETLTGLPGVDEATFGMHAMWMDEAGLIKAAIHEYLDDEPPTAVIFRLTWAGADFADSIRDETLWNKARETVLKPTASFTFGLLRDWLSAEIREGFPTLRG